MVSLTLGADALHPVLHSEGVKRMFTTTTGEPIPIRNGVVEALLAAADERRALSTALSPLAQGTVTRITAGPFADHTGVCTWSTAERVGLLMRILGGDIEVSVERRSVQPVIPAS
jgi:transcription antitermination factor NusG